MQSNLNPTVRDPNRLHALYRTALLDSSAEASFDRLTRLAVKTLRVPVALVSLVDEDRQFFKSCIGLPEPWASQRETPLSHSFCQHTIASQEPLLIEDARVHSLVKDNLAIPDINVIAYAGIPLITSGGFAIGSFCAIDTQPRSWSTEEVDILRELAASVLTEIELRLVTTELQSAAQEREALLSITSHELRTPLTSMLGYTQLLERRMSIGHAVSERDIRAIHTIREQGERVSRMLNALLDSTKLETNQFDLAFKPVDLRRLVERVIDEMRQSNPSHTLVFTTTDDPVTVQGDELRLEQVVQNLVGNAIKYSPKGSTVVVDVRHQDQQACLAVQDYGVGISAEAIPNLFQRFSRIRNVHTEHVSGLGLGLYIVKEIVAFHRGTIVVSSTEGQGSTFSVYIPLA